MPSIRKQISAATENALEGLKFRTQGAPALVTLAASTETAGETVSFSVGNNDFLVSANMNVRTDDSVSLEDDVLLQQEAVLNGEYFLEFPACTGTIDYLLIIEPVPG